MERLTERDSNCADPKEIYGVWVKNHDYISAANRLADYEDTGLTPEEIDMDYEAAETLITLELSPVLVIFTPHLPSRYEASSGMFSLHSIHIIPPRSR